MSRIPIRSQVSTYRSDEISIDHIRQITESCRDTIEKDHKDVEDRYRALFERSLFYVYVHDFEGNYIDANKTTLDTLGYTLDELKGLQFRSLITKDQYPLARQGP